MKFGEIIFYIVISLIALFFITKYVKLFLLPSETEKEYQRKLEESLKDEFIIDPETGAKLTLEQAQSGHWIAHDNEFKTVPENEIEKLLTEEEKKFEICKNYLKESNEYKKHKLTDKQLQVLEETKVLSKYDNWSYSDCFNLEYTDGLILLPAVEINDKTPVYFSNNYTEPQVLFWLKFDFDMGHYYLREKLSIEKFLDLIKKDDDLKLKNYESFTIRKSNNIIKVIKILEKFENQERIEIEFMDNNLFVKNERLASLEEIKRMEKIIKNLI
jgi:predicted DNA binding protein